MKSADLSWDDVERLTGVLAAHLPTEASGPAARPRVFDRIVGVARGGLIPAVLLASKLEIKQLESVQVRLYEGTTKLDAPAIVGGRPAASGPSGDPARTLVVDEILDSGTTLRFLRDFYPEACFAVLLGRRAAERGERSGALTAIPCGAGSPPVWVAGGLDSDDWVLFPWSPPEDRAAAP